MPKTVCRWRASELVRAIKAIERAGGRVSHVSMRPDGTFQFTLAMPGDQAEPAPAANPWDDVLPFRIDG